MIRANKKIKYTKEEIEEWREKANRWDKLAKKVGKIYMDDTKGIPFLADILASAFGWVKPRPWKIKKLLPLMRVKSNRE
jgi:5-bromo-4-chloroindolyl phosphate hydrolysis protein